MPKNGNGEMRSFCSDQVIAEVPELAAKMRKCMFDALEGRRQQETAKRVKEQKQREKEIRRLQKENDKGQRKYAALQAMYEAAITKK